MKKHPITRMKRWRVYILPNNQPSIELGDYWSLTRKGAIRLAAKEINEKPDEHWNAVRF